MVTRNVYKTCCSLRSEMTTQKTTKKNDFVEIKYTGYANNEIFDSNDEKDIKKLNAEAKPHKTIVIIGQGMVVPGLDKALEEKEIEKQYDVSFGPAEGFGMRNRNLIRTIPLKAFHEQKIDPQTGMVLALDNSLVKILSVSGARVICDFNNPLASKDIKYSVTITRFVTDDAEKADTLFDLFFRFKPKYEIKETEVVLHGPKSMEVFVTAFKERFKELMGKDLAFKEMSKEEWEEEQKKQAEQHQAEHDHAHAHSHDHEHSH